MGHLEPVQNEATNQPAVCKSSTEPTITNNTLKNAEQELVSQEDIVAVPSGLTTLKCKSTGCLGFVPINCALTLPAYHEWNF